MNRVTQKLKIVVRIEINLLIFRSDKNNGRSISSPLSINNYPQTLNYVNIKIIVVAYL